VRISGGEAKGRKLKVPAGSRPASERVRQAVFSSLGDAVDGAKVLDLYCGSGAYGLEALSRGAAHATFVDDDPHAVDACRTNAEHSGFSARAEVRRAAVERYLKRPSGRFDIVFADPPYAEALSDGLERALAKEGWLVVERRWSQRPPDDPEGVVLQADRRYGDTRILMFRRPGVE
jgi:16S rRNA (guanine966-N2)-methyltransferase